MVNIRVFSTPGCANCSLLKTFLKDNGVEFEDIDVKTNRDAAKEMIEKSGQMSVPVTDVEGKFIPGNDKEAILQAVKEAQ